MAIAVKMPKMSDTMTEGVIVDWNVKVGDQVSSGDILAEVETDKATMDLENYDKGEILHLAVGAGEAIPVDGVVAIVGKKGEKFEDLLVAAPAAKNDMEAIVEEKTTVDSKSIPEPLVGTPQVIAADPDTGRLKASPLAKKMAEEKGINLNSISGSGDGGRIIKLDIENYTPAAAGAAVQVGQESFEDIQLSQMRKTIAKRLSESKFAAPHFYLTMEINMDRAVAARQRMNEMAPVKISMNDLIIKAAAAALKQNPKVNSSWLGDRIRINHHIHIGVAMAVDEGLLVPVVRFADNKSLSQISAEVKEYSAKAKDKKLQPEDWAGNTFTISNLGMFGIEEFTAIVNPPDACIMAVGTVKDIAGVIDGEIRPTKVMKVTLSCDHRAVDGAVGSGFLKSFKALLEDPVTLLV
jgi:pyruvate dehydrogenase E2 component (dihydrolipoamide acetyltransferase)